MKKLFLGLGLLLVFLLLIFYNQKKAKREILMSQTPVYGVALVDSPLNASADQPVEFIWKVTAPDTATSLTTTIYYSPVSSPSALTTSDSPQAVGYYYSLTDYFDGIFSLPDTFSASTSLLKGTVFYRAYARVGNQHLWSKEYQLEVHQ